MIKTIGEEFPSSASCTVPEGGMFVWVTLPENCNSMEVFEKALSHNVAVLLGIPFYVDGGGHNTLHLNFSNSAEEKITEGITRLAKVVRALCD